METGPAGLPASARTALPHLLRRIRIDQQVSQLELALRLGVSQRHVSFVEAGRARPSRELLLAWMQEVATPPSIRNAALLHAGYAPLDRTQEGRVGDDGDAAALQQLLAAHDPFAGLVFNADWHIIAMNRGGRWLCSQLMPDLCAHPPGPQPHLDMIAALAHPQGLLSRAREAAAAGANMLTQLHSERWARPSLAARVAALAESFSRRFGNTFAPAAQATSKASAPTWPPLKLAFDTPFGVLSFLKVQSVLGLPQDITLTSLRLELWFPADAHTAQHMQAQVPALATGA